MVEVPIIVRDSADIPGTMVSGAGATFGPKGWEIALEFGEEGAKLFGDLTAQNVGRQFAIILDGEVYSAPVIQDAILSGRASISGTFTQKEASDLASVLENPLQAGVTILNESNTSASLGSDAIRSGLSAGLIGALLTIVLVTIYYRLAGIVANIALVVFVILLFGAMGMFSSVLTLPGIAGVLLTLGMAIDANVLIYERFREERALGKSLATSIEAAYEKAFSAIFDSNLTTLITALILYVKATGPVRGFAVALVIGVVASMFSALLASRNLFAWGLKMGWIKDIKMASLIGATKFDFMGKARLSTAVSVLVIVGSLGYVAYRGEANFGVDFKGGDRLVLVSEGSKFETLDPIRNALSEVKMADGSIKDYSDATVQTEQSAGAEYVVVLGPEGSASAISSHLTAKFPEAKFRVAGSEAVGSLVGRELAFSSFVALTLGMLAILVYVAVRFEFSFAVGAVVALLHDVIITLGVFSILHKELSLVIVGAILTIAGYSVNDTIVVYDRIREGFKNGASGSNSDIMNRSINETLSRTILTGGVTLLTTLVLYFLGGPVLGDFALVMLIGVIVGTYSSIFIASPIVLWWSSLGGRDLKTEIKKAEEASRATA
jgi:SecD/SecF fusion protein